MTLSLHQSKFDFFFRARARARMRARFLFLLLLPIFFSFTHRPTLHPQNPPALYLTWKQDPTTTMVIHWHTLEKEKQTLILYQKEGDKNWSAEEGTYSSMPRAPVLIHTVELTHLDPGTTYSFRIGKETTTYKFRTLPKTPSRPIRFVVGGDIYFDTAPFHKMNEQVAAFDPDFVVLGGDIAYTFGIPRFLKDKNSEQRRWQYFLKEWKRQMVTSDGRLIPMLPVLGNHDIRSKQKETLFFQLFAFPQKACAYRAIDIGTFCSLILLDTGHYDAVPGKQTKWLKRTLEKRKEATYLFPIYHVSAYPSVYSYNGDRPREIRANWVPLFEENHIQVAFEHHNHAFKRTFPILGQSVSPDGVIYLGDGCWGVSPRCPIDPKTTWYLEKVAKKNSLWLVTLDYQTASFQAIDENGKTLDELSLPAHSLLK